MGMEAQLEDLSRFQQQITVQLKSRFMDIKQSVGKDYYGSKQIVSSR